jgi:hypothetical protein
VLDSVTVNPPVGAATFNVTVPVGFVTPPVTLAGVRVTAVTAGGFTVSAADCVAPLNVAEMFPVVVEATACVVTVKLGDTV